MVCVLFKGQAANHQSFNFQVGKYTAQASLTGLVGFVQWVWAPAMAPISRFQIDKNMAHTSQSWLKSCVLIGPPAYYKIHYTVTAFC